MECDYFSFPNFSEFLNFLDFCQLGGREHDSGHTSDVCIVSKCRCCGLTLLSDAYDNYAANFREVFYAVAYFHGRYDRKFRFGEEGINIQPKKQFRDQNICIYKEVDQKIWAGVSPPLPIPKLT